jgi:clan AA aspartic protease
MGTVIEQFTLTNSTDVGMAKRGLIPKSKVRSVTVHAVVDTGADTLVITEELCEKLGLDTRPGGTVTLAGGGKEQYKRSEPVQITWRDRDCNCDAYVLPGGDILMGAIPLEDLDLMVNPHELRVVGAHGSTRAAYIY